MLTNSPGTGSVDASAGPAKSENPEGLPGDFTVSVFVGHTGGHLFPGLAFSEKLRREFPHCKIHLVSSEKARPLVAGIPGGIFDEAVFLPEFPFSPRISFRQLIFLMKLSQAFFQSWQYLARARPDLCVGFGSYVSFPGLLLGALKKIPTLIHEQNLLPGKATCWLARHMDCVAVSFPATFESMKFPPRHVVGFPLRAGFLQGEERPGAAGTGRPGHAKTPGVFNLLVVGGSQGAHRLNEIVIGALERFTDEERRKIAVNHITGTQDFDWVLKSYQRLGIVNQTFAFFDRMDELYGEADMAITRAGAGTLFELAAFKLPAVVVPYPHAAKHQKANAEFFYSRKAIILKQEEELDADEMAGQIRNLKEDTARRRELAAQIGGLAVTDASARLVRLAQNLLPACPRGKNGSH